MYVNKIAAKKIYTCKDKTKIESILLKTFMAIRVEKVWLLFILYIHHNVNLMVFLHVVMLLDHNIKRNSVF